MTLSQIEDIYKGYEEYLKRQSVKGYVHTAIPLKVKNACADTPVLVEYGMFPNMSTALNFLEQRKKCVNS